MTRLLLSVFISASISFAMCDLANASSKETSKKHHVKSTHQIAKTDVNAKVELNTADATMISSSAKRQGLKGLGLKRAEAIVAYRKEHGKFKSLEDLKNVRGITDRYLKKNHAQLEKLFVIS